jgi:hypothetical protein
MKKVVFIFYSLFFFHGLFSQEAGFDWARTIGSTSFESVNDIAVDNEGNSYITNGYNFTMDFDPGEGVYESTPVGSSDIYVNKLDENGEFLWSLSIGGISGDASYSIHFDGLEHIYITGYFSGTVDFNPGAEVFELTSMGSGDCFILKLDTDGNFVWVKSFGDGLLDIGVEITTDEAGNVYTTGTYQGTVDFNPGVGVFDITSNGEEDVFIHKLNSDGEFIWAKSIGGASEDKVASIKVDDTGQLYLAGNYQEMCDFDPGLSTYFLTSSGFFDHFILKLDSFGVFDWAVTFGGNSGDFLAGMEIDNFGNIYSTGFFSGTIDINPGDVVFEFISNGSNDIFVQKLDNDGNFIWAKRIGNVEQERAASLKLDASNNLYITGYFVGTTDFNPNAGVYNITSLGSSDIFILKLNDDGNFIFAKSIGGGSSDEAVAIDLNLDGDLYLTGNYRLSFDFNPNMGEYYLTSNGEVDIFILKLNACSPNATTDVINSCISYTWINGTTYYEDNNSATVTLTNMLGCDSVVTLDLTINEVDITTTATGGVLSSNAMGASYQWLDCNDAYSEIAGATNQSYTPIDDGDYAVKVTNGSCTDTSACIAVDGVGLTDNNNLSQIHLYPNPNNGLFNINLGQVQATLIQISSANGTINYSNSTNLTGIHQIALNISAGLYFVDVWTESGTYQMKFVVE